MSLEKENLRGKVGTLNGWSRFWKWYEGKILGSVILIAIIQIIQIPHMWWAADVYLEMGLVSRVNPVLDFFFYGIDLIEIISIINVTMMLIALIRKNINNTITST